MSSRCDSLIMFKFYVLRVPIESLRSNSFVFLLLYTVEILKKIDIPSVFIGETSANSLKEEFTYEKG